MIVLSRFCFRKNDEIFKDLIQAIGVYLTSFTIFSGDIKENKSSENDQSTGHFQSFFFFIPDPKSEKKIPVNQLIKNLWPKAIIHYK